MITFDLEGDGLYQQITRIWCGVFEDMDSGEVWEFRPHQIEEMLSFMDKCDHLAGHNVINFDFAVLKKLYNYVYEGKVTDTFILSQLANPDRVGGHSVDNWSKIIGKEQKVVHEDWSKFTPAMLTRCRVDTSIQCDIYRHLQEELKPNQQIGIDWTESIDLEHAIAFIVADQEHYGAPFNTPKAIEYEKLLSGLLEEIEVDVNKVLGFRVSKPNTHLTRIFKKDGTYQQNIVDWFEEEFIENKAVGGPFSKVEFEQIRPSMYEAVKKRYIQLGWIPTQFNPPTDAMIKKHGKTVQGSPKTPTVEELEDFANRTGYPELKVIARYGSIANRRNILRSWIAVALDNNNRLPAGAFTNGTNTGRFRHITVVNVPRASSDKEGNLIWYPEEQASFFGTEMRSLFYTDDEDYEIVGADAAGLELGCLAHYMQDHSFTDVLLNGDIHTLFWEKAGGIVYVTSRQDMKTTTYAWLYGAGVYKLGTTCTAKEGDDYVAYGKDVESNLMKGLPQLDNLVKLVKKSSRRGFLRGLDGRKIFMRRSGFKVQENKALNTLLQSTGSIIMKKFNVELMKLIKGLRVHQIISMHDELQFMCHKEDKASLLIAIDQAIEITYKHYKFNLPLEMDSQSGQNWAETH